MSGILVCNDDGIDSFFLKVLVEALRERFAKVWVAAPKHEQSWKGRSISRQQAISVEQRPEGDWGCAAWAIDGTPTDCANIALSHLVDERPAALVSGINIGFNVSANLMFCSGTIAAALEGALWGLPALAFSKALGQEAFSEASRNPGQLNEAAAKSLRTDAARAALWTAQAIDDQSSIAKASKRPPAKVININFSENSGPDTPVVDTVAARLEAGPLFVPSEDGGFRFQWQEITEIAESQTLPTDLEVLREGKVSRTVLDFTAAGGGT